MKIICADCKQLTDTGVNHRCENDTCNTQGPMNEKPFRQDFYKELEELINKHSVENVSNTPDFILAEYLKRCLEAFELASNHRVKWHHNETQEIKSELDGLKPADDGKVNF